jgi:hypothetical protein
MFAVVADASLPSLAYLARLLLLLLRAEVLGSILGALKAIVAVIGMTRMTPPIKDLLPRLTPILKNRCVALRGCKGQAEQQL